MTPARSPRCTRTRLRTGTVGLLLAALLPAGGLALSPAAGAADTAVATTQTLAQVGAPAVQLRSTLAGSFQAHTALAAVTESAYLTKGDRLGRAAGAVAAASRQQLATDLGGTTPAAAAVRDALAAHDAAKLAYAVGVDRYRGRADRAATAERQVAAARARVVATLAALVPVPAAELSALLTAQDARDAAATRALGARSPQVYSLVQVAHMSTAALARRVAVALDARDGLAGSATSPAAELRASTVNLAQAHVVQTGLASDAGLTYGQRSAAYAGAVAALDLNTAQWTTRVRELSDPANAAAFRAQWVRHIADYSRYVGGHISKNTALRRAAVVDLEDFAGDVAPTLSRASGLPVARIVPETRTHVRGTVRVIDLQAARSPEQFPVAAAGTKHFAVVGDLLAASAAARLGLSEG